MCKVYGKFILLFVVFFSTLPLHADEAAIIDSRHYSSVFGESRNYRIFLPPGYEKNQLKRYPVIYFFHGWSQRYFGITRGDGYDKDDHNAGDTIAKFVSEHDVIVVKWDGFNIREGDDYNLRPYNIGPVETHRQFPLYFPELVRYIDSHYRTIPDREHRAVSGLSMGGFMTFWIGGKYPDLVCAAGNFCGSPEFRIGPKAFPVEYRHIDMYKNYGGMRIRLNFGNNDFIRAYHHDMNRIFPQIMDNYEYKIYEAEHSTCGLGEMFTFIMDTFENPPPEPETWHHIDVYPEFSVWGYAVNSDRMLPGFTIIENVNEGGFRCSVREFLPDGELMPYVTVSVLTAPRYEKEKEYIINDVSTAYNESKQYVVRSDKNGRLMITVDGYCHDIGINMAGNGPNLSTCSYHIENMNWASPLKNVDMSVRVLNKGGIPAERVSAELRTTRDNVRIIKGKTEFGNIDINEIKQSTAPFTFYISEESVEVVQFKLTIKDGLSREWSDTIDVPIRIDVPEFANITIADGKQFTVAEAGTTKVALFIGTGNGDGIANPGESIVILVRDEKNDLYRRNYVYTSDTFINPNGINPRQSNYWGSYDHVGGSEKYSMPVIASDCPEGRIIEFFTEHWLPDYPDHIIQRGKAKITITGEDKTPPQIRWADIQGDNILQVNVIDGGDIAYVKAALIYKKSNYTRYTHENLALSLNNDGIDGDRIPGDYVFSVKIPEQRFGLFTVDIEAEDIFGNRGEKSFNELMTVY